MAAHHSHPWPCSLWGAAEALRGGKAALKEDPAVWGALKARSERPGVLGRQKGPPQPCIARWALPSPVQGLTPRRARSYLLCTSLH